MMIRTITTLCILFTLGTVNAQEVRIGAGFNTVSVGSTGADATISGDAGFQIEADAQFGERVYLQPGLGYVLRNLTFTTISADPVGAQLIESSYTNNALRISLMGGYRFLDEFDRQSFNIRGFFGPSLLIGMGSNFQNDLITNVPDNDMQFYLTVGAGIERDFLFADVGYDFAMSDAFDLAGAEGRLNMLRVNVGVRLRFLGRTTDTPTFGN